MINGFSTILRGVNGQFENTRVLGALGVVAYIFSATFFEWYTVVWKGNTFDITAYCLAFPGGLGAAIAAIGLTSGSKEKSVATAQVIRDNGSAPAAPTSP